MDSSIFILPFLFLIPVLGGFFVNLSTTLGKAIGSLMIILTLGLIGVFYNSVSSMQNAVLEKKHEINALKGWKSTIVAKLATIVASHREELLPDRKKMANFVKFGWTSHHPLFQEAIKADKARVQLMEVLPRPNNLVTIENLPNSVDKMVISWAFEELGYEVHNKQNQPYLNPKPENENSKKKKLRKKKRKTKKDKSAEEKPKEKTLEFANTLFYGHKVRNHDIKLIAYTMIRAGVELKMIRPMKKQTKENARSIRFDWSKNYSKRETLSVEKLETMNRFKR